MHSYYLKRPILTWRKTVDAIVTKIRAETVGKYSFDAIAVRGMSGMFVGPAVADILGKKLIVIRKPSEHNGSHGCRIEYDEELNGLNQLDFIIIDDLISSGRTVKAICADIKQHTSLPQSNLKAVFLYQPESMLSDGQTTVHQFSEAQVFHVFPSKEELHQIELRKKAGIK